MDGSKKSDKELRRLEKQQKKEQRRERKEQKLTKKAAAESIAVPEPVEEEPPQSTKRPRDEETVQTPQLKKQKTEDAPVVSNQSHNSITVSGEDSNLSPVESFATAPFPPALLETTKGFAKPTPIQAHCWPYLVAGRDMIGIAETGSGKTLAFGLPGLKLLEPSFKKPSMLVLAPTRELAQQNHDVLGPAAKAVKLQTTCIYGGIPKQPQIAALNRGTQVVVGCPGRLLDLATEGSLDLSKVRYLVLDEADRMLDMGFEKDIRQLIGLCAQKRQTVMFSATWPKAIQNLAQEFLNNPIRVTVGSEDLSANRRVQQIVEVIDQNDRRDRLLQLLRSYHGKKDNKIIIFVLYKKEAAEIERFLNTKGWNCIAIHGDKSAEARTQALDSFKKSRPPLLIATDVAARGLDIPLVEYVINYSFPLTVEDYVHRIGRTGRAGATGISHTFFQKFDKSNSGELIGVLRKAGQHVPEELMAFGTHVKKKEPTLGKINLETPSTTKHITFDDDDE